MANSAVFNFRQNAGSDWISLTEVGREFHATQQPETHDHQWWLDVSVVRRMLKMQRVRTRVYANAQG